VEVIGPVVSVPASDFDGMPMGASDFDASGTIMAMPSTYVK
jgi:hypothetical protein